MINLLAVIISICFLFSQIIRIQLGNGLVFSILDISVGIILVFGFLWFIYKKKSSFLLKDRIKKGIVFFSSIIILSLLLNINSLNLQQFFISSLYILRWISYAFIFILVFDLNKRVKKKIEKIMLLTGVFFVLAGYIQFAYYQELKNLFYLGWDEHMYRLFGVFFDPNFSGIFLSLFLLFLVNKRLQTSINPLTKNKLFFSILIAFTLGALILTFSRSAFVVFILTFMIFFSLIGKKKWIIIPLIFIIFIGIIFSQRFYIESINPFRTTSTKARLASMKEGIEIFSRKPIMGVGFNSYRYSQLQYGYRKQVDIDRSHADAGADNSFLFILATTGIVGFATYLYMLFSIFKNVYRSPLALSSIIGICVASMFTNALFFPPLMLWMWLILGTMESN